jgi:hypothetical protein
MKKITMTIGASILLAASLTGCVTSPSTYIDPAIQAQAPQLIIASKPVGKGYYALLEKVDGRWKVITIQATPFYGRNNDEQEILFVNRGLRSIAPSYDPRMFTTGEGAGCTPMAQLFVRNRYWLCNSYFSSIRIGTTVGGNIVSCALTFCLAAGTNVEFDRDKVQEVVLDSDLINIVKKRIALEDHNSVALKLFNDAYRDNIRQIREIQDETAQKWKEN